MSTNDIIREFITDKLLHGTLPMPLKDDDQLVETGLLDSLRVITLLGFLEEKFSIQIPGEEVIPENFDSVAALTALVEHQQVK